MALTVRGTILQTPAPGELEVLEDHLVVVTDDGVIVEVVPARGRGADVVLDLDQVLLPGLVDTHLHAPQWPLLGTGLDLPLQEWLDDRTFPLEARFADTDLARGVWRSMVPALLAEGTTTAVYFGSIHEEATVALAETCIELGQRAFVGRVAMDHREGAPEWYRDATPSEAVAASQRSIEAVAALPGAGERVQPIITPRFVPACSHAALVGLGELAQATGVRVQTHCSESDWQHAAVLDRYGHTDTAALASFGLLADHTVLAHGTHLTDDDRALIVETGAGVAHCPLSNSYFANAVFPARRNLAAGMRLGLGSDVAGGPTPSMFAQCGHAVTASRMLEDGVDVGRTEGRGVPDSRIDVVTAFWMATAGGADLLGIPVGLLAPGRAFDAVAVDTAPLRTDLPAVDGDVDPDAVWAGRFEQVVRRASPAVVDRVWVDGHQVAGRTHP